MSPLLEKFKHVPTWLLATKFIVATGYRAMYPLAPVIALHLHVDVSQITALLASFQFVNVFVCALAPSAQQFFGLRNLSVVCLAGQGILLELVAFSGTFIQIAVSIVLFGVAKGLLWPTILATANSICEKEEQGKVVAKVEISWGLSSIIGVPAVGFLMSTDFKIPFVILGIICFILAAVGWRMLKHVVQSKGDENKEKTKFNFSMLCAVAKQVYHTPLAIAVFLTSVLLMSSMYVVFVSFGLWLTEVHGFDAAGIGAASLTIGAADLLAEITLIKVLKHYAGRKFLVFGFVGYIIAFVFLMVAWQPNMGLALGLVAVFFCFFQFEMLVVANLGLVGNIVLAKRRGEEENNPSRLNGVLESILFGAGALGAVAGSLLSTVVWKLGPGAPGMLGLFSSAVCLFLWVYTNNYSTDRIEEVVGNEEEKTNAPAEGTPNTLISQQDPDEKLNPALL